jgi:hypothetical protein
MNKWSSVPDFIAAAATTIIIIIITTTITTTTTPQYKTFLWYMIFS